MGCEMEQDKMPSAWAIVRNGMYGLGGTAMVGIMVLFWIGLLPVGLALWLVAVLIPTVLVADWVDVYAILTNNNKVHAREQDGWSFSVALLTRSFQMARQGMRRLRTFETSRRNHPLREVGAVGRDLRRIKQQATARQSGGRKAGTGGHKKPASSSGDDSDGDGEPPAHLPLLLTDDDLAALLSVSKKTLQNKPAHQLPPSIRIPGCRGPRYRLREVLAWLDGLPAAQPAPQPRARKAIGRPRIAAQLGLIGGKGGVQ